MKFSVRTSAFFFFVFLSLSVFAQERLIIVNEGVWQTDNGRLSYFEDGRVVSNQWFRDVNKAKLGDTPNDIIAINDNLFAIALNWSNIIQFIDQKGKAVAETEDIPNNRRLATDGTYLYVTSYGHECVVNGREVTFTKGFVAKIDTRTFKTVAVCEVGYEPEGIALHDGRLFVANTGGYADQEYDHDYEKTVSVIDSGTMTLVRTINTGQPNLFGKISQVGQYICINSPGDYYDTPPATLILDCKAAEDGKPDADCFVKLNCSASFSTPTRDGKILAVGAAYSFIQGGYKETYLTIDPAAVFATRGASGYASAMPGTMLSDIKAMKQPYGIYENPYTGYFYATDAASFAEGGTLVQWDPQGKKIGQYRLYINPGHFLAIKPDGWQGIVDVSADPADADASGTIYNLQGIPVANPLPGQLYIRSGRKYIHR